ncbi:ABC transporter permease [uncultured Methylophaga sp.]|uniref:ABC transporter permease n=1 Tax=uncultured Methylophaga sp. TaxID=285271 RepID=UPI002618D669|nr:ABC transporter permease [uncultured Methylophaga sp.]
MMLLKLACYSLGSRLGTVLLTVLMMSVSVFVLLSVENIRHQAKESFQQSVSDVDLIVGPRTGQINLLLYSIFHIGVPTHNLSWNSYRMLQQHQDVDWTIPLSLGDSHQGYRVVGTEQQLFAHFRYRADQALDFASGQAFNKTYDAVVGAEVASSLGYQAGDEIVLAHGIADTSFSRHDNHPFQISGILKPTGTPIDRSVFISLTGLEAMHADFPGADTAPNLTPQSVTAVMVGLKSKIKTFTLQREINQYAGEALQAILPGVALSSLWSMLGGVEQTLWVISLLVLLGALIGMVNVLLLSMRERQHELAVLRALGYRPGFLFALLQLEALLITVSSIIVALLALAAGDIWLRQWLLSQFGLFLSESLLQPGMAHLLMGIVLAAVVSALLPAINAYRQGLNLQLR